MLGLCKNCTKLVWLPFYDLVDLLLSAYIYPSILIGNLSAFSEMRQYCLSVAFYFYNNLSYSPIVFISNYAYSLSNFMFYTIMSFSIMLGEFIVTKILLISINACKFTPVHLSNLV